MTPATEALVYGGLLRVLWKANKFEEVVRVCQGGLRQTKEGTGWPHPSLRKSLRHTIKRAAHDHC